MNNTFVLLDGEGDGEVLKRRKSDSKGPALAEKSIICIYIWERQFTAPKHTYK